MAKPSRITGLYAIADTHYLGDARLVTAVAEAIDELAVVHHEAPEGGLRDSGVAAVLGDLAKQGLGFHFLSPPERTRNRPPFQAGCVGLSIGILPIP